MPAINAKRIMRPRNIYFCEVCGCKIDGEHWRLYGYPDRGDKPYAIRVCLECQQRIKEAEVV